MDLLAEYVGNIIKNYGFSMVYSKGEVKEEVTLPPNIKSLEEEFDAELVDIKFMFFSNSIQIYSNGNIERAFHSFIDNASDDEIFDMIIYLIKKYEKQDS